MTEPEDAGPRRWWHVVAPVVVVMLAGVFQLTYRDSGHWIPPGPWQTVVYGSSCLALLFRYRHPVAVAWATVVLSATVPVLRPHTVIIDGPTIVALYTLARRTGCHTAWPVAGPRRCC